MYNSRYYKIFGKYEKPVAEDVTEIYYVPGWNAAYCLLITNKSKKFYMYKEPDDYFVSNEDKDIMTHKIIQKVFKKLIPKINTNKIHLYWLLSSQFFKFDNFNKDFHLLEEPNNGFYPFLLEDIYYYYTLNISLSTSALKYIYKENVYEIMYDIENLPNEIIEEMHNI